MAQIKLTKKELSILKIEKFTELNKTPSHYCVVTLNRSQSHPIYVQSFVGFRRSLRHFPKDYVNSVVYEFHLVEFFK